ncbi:MAG: serine/threonine-protein kinase [Acidobacteriota bacterium]
MNEPSALTAAAHQAIKASLLTALDLEAGARAAWLSDLDHSDGALSREVRRLLDAHERAGRFLDLPDGDDEDGDRPLPANFAIGPFVIERELGRGGMGMVYLGTRRDHGYVQRVAIKVLGPHVPPGAVARLRDERRILAGLNHACIAHFVDGGTTSEGLPYLAMEYVAGRPVTSSCDEAGLDVPARLRLFLKICGAVHFAHQHLVVHRDIKPSNILVTADGTPKLLDFGIAKLLEAGPDAHVATVQVLTPHYASPEQAAGGAVTTATDVYSLGMLLYELLTGSSPYRGVSRDSSPLSVLDAVRTAEPERPSQAAARAVRVGLDADLDAIILKALRKSPADRYGSAEQFAADLERYLAGRPVLARQGSTVYAARKFVGRHRAGVAAAVVALASLTAATGVSLWQSRAADRQRLRAEARFADVRKLANSFVFEFDETVRDIPGTTAARKLVIARSLGYLEELARDVHDDLPMQRELAAAYQRIGDVQGNPFMSNLGERSEALVNYRRALNLREPLGSSPTATAADRAGLASALSAVGDLLWAGGDFASALVHYERASGLDEALAAAAPESRTAAYGVARSAYQMGQALTKLGRFSTARQHYARSRVALDGGALAHDTAEHRRFQAVAAMKEADCLLREGMVDPAVALYRQSAATLGGLSQADPASSALRRTYAFVLNRVAAAEGVAGRYDLAAPVIAEALAAQEALGHADQGNSQVQGDIAMSLSTRGGLELLHGRPADAERVLGRALAAYDALRRTQTDYVDLRSDHAVAVRRLGDARLGSGDVEGALRHYDEARVMLDATPRDGEYAPERALVYLRMSETGRRVPAASADDVRRWRAEALDEWTRLSAAGVRAWMGEFGGATRLAEAMAGASGTGTGRPTR